MASRDFACQLEGYGLTTASEGRAMKPQVLIPFYAPEAITLQQAGGVAARAPETVRG
jgi:hypothetical protein